MKTKLLLFFVLASAFLFNQCVNNANPVGSDYLNRDNPGSLNYQIFQAAASDTFFQKTTYTGFSTELSLGTSNDISCLSLIRFSSFSDTVDIDSAVVSLYVKRLYGDSDNQFTLSVHLATEDWNESDLTWDSFDQNSVGEEMITLTADLTSLEDDTVSRKISFHLPMDLVEIWNDTSRSEENMGMVLLTEEDYILSFHSAEGSNPPTLNIYSHEDTTVSKSTRYPSHDTFISQAELIPTSDRLYICDGTAYRTFLYFDVSSIPPEATINQALITLTSDQNLSFPDHEESFNLSSVIVMDSLWTVPDIAYDSTRVAYGLVDEDTVYVNITSYVQSWTSGEDSNFGVMVYGTSERTDLLSRAFYSTTADSALCPRLRIYFSLPPASQF